MTRVLVILGAAWFGGIGIGVALLWGASRRRDESPPNCYICGRRGQAAYSYGRLGEYQVTLGACSEHGETVWRFVLSSFFALEDAESDDE